MPEHIHGEGYCEACVKFGAEQATKEWEERLPVLLGNSYNAGYVKARSDADA